MKYFFTVLAISIIFLFNPYGTFAISDPLSVPNNHFGIHILEPNDLTDAAALVNSQGGNWGYVTLVIPTDDRKKDKWQEVFDRMRELHLIPIVRIATQLSGDYWKKPNLEDITPWVDFLNSLNWVVKNRYVVIFNEPNHAKEWGGTLSPQEYAQILNEFSTKLKKKSDDFFIITGGLDASAPNSSETMDEVLFLQKMKTEIPDIFDHIDGWSSHSYPNPGFSGSPYATGRGTVRNYQWEKSILLSLGIPRDLPVFITETGWPHREGINYNYGFVSESVSAKYLKTAFISIWSDPSIVAITPFVLSYPSYPFDNFSWKKPDGQTFYNQYTLLQTVPKIKGVPEQIIDLSFVGKPLPERLITDSEYTFEVKIRNSGQAIFAKNDDFNVTIISSSKDAATLETFRTNIEWADPIDPYRIGSIRLHMHTPSTPGKYQIQITLLRGEKRVKEVTEEITLIEPPSLSVRVTTGLNTSASGHDFSLIIYDDKEIPAIKYNRVSVVEGNAQIVKLKDVVVGKEYRLVIQKPYYLPRQEKLIFKDRSNSVDFKAMLPMDMDLDGKFTFSDYWIMIFHPIFVLSLLF